MVRTITQKCGNLISTFIRRFGTKGINTTGVEDEGGCPVFIRTERKYNQFLGEYGWVRPKNFLMTNLLSCNAILPSLKFAMFLQAQNVVYGSGHRVHLAFPSLYNILAIWGDPC
jgi:hypothetical protein